MYRDRISRSTRVYPDGPTSGHNAERLFSEAGCPDALPKPYYTLEYQFRLMDQALAEARNLLKAKYYTSCISHCYQVAHRGAAGLLFGIQARVDTERDVGIGFESGFVTEGRTDPRFGQAYRRLWEMRHKADFEFEYVAGPEDAKEAMDLAEAFHAECQRLKATITVGA